MDSSIAAKHRQAAFERAAQAIGGRLVSRRLPSTKASALKRELYVAELMAGVAERVSAVAERLASLEVRVAGLEHKPKAPAKAAQ